MTIDRHQDQLHALGVPPAHPDVLKMLPIVHVAWADGGLDDFKLDRVDCLARYFGVLEASEDAMRRWLARPPVMAELDQGCALLHRLALAPDEPNITIDDLYELIASAEWVARSRCVAFDAPWAVSSREQWAIEEIVTRLGVSLGGTWAALWHDLHMERAA